MSIKYSREIAIGSALDETVRRKAEQEETITFDQNVYKITDAKPGRCGFYTLFMEAV